MYLLLHIQEEVQTHDAQSGTNQECDIKYKLHSKSKSVTCYMISLLVYILLCKNIFILQFECI